MGQHRTSPTPRAATVVGAALTAGTLLLAGPAAPAFGAPPSGPGPGDPGGPSGGSGGGEPGGGGTTAHSVGGRPELPRPAPLVTFGQTLGDGLFDNNPMLNGSPFGAGYHSLLGGSGTPDNGDGIRQPGEAYQGTYTGILNQTPLGGVYDTVTNKHHPAASVTNNAGITCGTSTAICR